MIDYNEFVTMMMAKVSDTDHVTSRDDEHLSAAVNKLWISCSWRGTCGIWLTMWL